MPALELIPEELEESTDAAIPYSVTCVQMRRVVILGRLAVLKCMNTLVNILYSFGEGWGAEKGINEALFEKVEPRHNGGGEP
jgi:hypothetical protein